MLFPNGYCWQLCLKCHTGYSYMILWITGYSVFISYVPVHTSKPITIAKMELSIYKLVNDGLRQSNRMTCMVQENHISVRWTCNHEELSNYILTKGTCS